MFLLILFLVFLLFIVWLLFSPLEIILDTREPLVSVRWTGIGTVKMLYSQEAWRIRLHLFFLRREWDLEKLIMQPKKKSPKKAMAKNGKAVAFPRILRMLRTFRVTRWQAAIDTGNFTANARYYPINFIPLLQGHFSFNFHGENYLAITAHNSPWRMIYAWIK